MNEYNEHNLPADFDDLSKHAPLLDKLRREAVSGQRSAVDGRDAGFIVPENYFDELTERIVSIVNLTSRDADFNAVDNSFPLPENYFEELNDRINAIITLSDTADHRPLTADSFPIPEEYFNELDETLNTKLALDNLRQDDGFEIPEGYFEKLSGKILSHIAVGELNQGSDNDVPSGYFDRLADRISERIAEEESIFADSEKTGEADNNEKNIERGRIIVFAEVLKRYSRPLSIAASVTLLISVSTWFFNRGNTIQSDHIAKYVQPKQKFTPVIPLIQIPDFVITPGTDKIAVIDHPKHSLNHQEEKGVKEVNKKDIMEQLDILDESVVADYVSTQNPEIKIVQQEEYLNDQMLNYILDNNIDASDINKLP